jgi:myo-inositol-1(or 4)-monophosphatase
MPASLKSVAVSTAGKAGAILKKYYGKKIPGVRSKGTSLVTDVDIWCNNVIIKEIKKNFPEHNIISEESRQKRTTSPYTWFIDPIDGTHNYIRGIPLFGTTVAVARKDEVVAGAIYLPAFNKLYVAERGKGAFCNGRRIRVSKMKKLDFSFIVFDSSTKGKRKKMRFMRTLSTMLFDERMVGCAIVAAAWLAEGTIDSYVIFKTNAWDIAAGFLLIEEAGGKITDFNGKKWTPHEGSYVASNKHLHQKMLKLVQG